MEYNSYSFSVCTSIYKNDNPKFVKMAIDSMIVNQSVKPSEIIVVQDGPVSSDLSELISTYDKNYPGLFRIICFEVNHGLGNALRVGVENAKYELVARMDSDDICLPDRFEKQLEYFKLHPECDIVGGQITEFINIPENIIGRREVPLENNAIYDYMKMRCALNHVTVMFKKSAVLKAGNYQDWFWNEDYFLWVRMMKEKSVFANIPDVLVNVRSGAGQYARRGGKKYFDSEIGIKKLMLNEGLISKKQFVINYIERFIIQLLLPNSIRGWVFRTFARER